MTGDPQVENQLPWYVTQPYRDYMTRTGQSVTVRPPRAGADPDVDVGSAPYEANYRIYKKEDELMSADELALQAGRSRQLGQSRSTPRSPSPATRSASS